MQWIYKDNNLDEDGGEINIFPIESAAPATLGPGRQQLYIIRTR